MPPTPAAPASPPGCARLRGPEAYGDSVKSPIKKICAKCEVTPLDIAPAQLATNGLVPAVVSALQKDPSIKYLITPDGAFIGLLPSALKAAGIEGVKIAGGAADINNTQALVSGTEAAWTLEPTDQFGWVAVDIAAHRSLGMAIEEDKIGRPQQLARRTSGPRPTSSPIRRTTAASSRSSGAGSDVCSTVTGAGDLRVLGAGAAGPLPHEGWRRT